MGAARRVQPVPQREQVIGHRPERPHRLDRLALGSGGDQAGDYPALCRSSPQLRSYTTSIAILLGTARAGPLLARNLVRVLPWRERQVVVLTQAPGSHCPAGLSHQVTPTSSNPSRRPDRSPAALHFHPLWCPLEHGSLPTVWYAPANRCGAVLPLSPPPSRAIRTRLDDRLGAPPTLRRPWVLRIWCPHLPGLPDDFLWGPPNNRSCRQIRVPRSPAEKGSRHKDVEGQELYCPTLA